MMRLTGSVHVKVIILMAVTSLLFLYTPAGVEGASYDLLVSLSPDRSAAVPLNGETVFGSIYVFTDPDSGVKGVKFYLNDPLKTSVFRNEKRARFDLAGSKGDGTAKPFYTSQLTDGANTVDAVIELSAGGSLEVTATFTVDNNGPALVFSPEAMTFSVDEGGTGTGSAELDTNDGTVADYTLAEDVSWLTVSPLTSSTPQMLTLSVDATGLTSGTYTATVTASADGYLPAALPVTLVVGSSYELMMSVSPDRSSPVPLDGETVGGTIYGFVSPETGISKVSFYLDDPNMTGSPFQVENSGPWDIGGTASNGDSLPYDTTLLSDESHTITAAIELSDGGTDVASATFTVDNNGPALVFSPEVMAFSVDEGGTGTGSAELDTNDGTVADYTLAEDVSWLTVSPLTSSTPQMLTLSVDATGLASGTYTAAVTASADGYLSANLRVTLVVGSGYDLMMSVSPDRSSPVLLDGQTVAGTMESVLVVATDPERALLVAILTRAGYATIEAREGAAGARKILDRSPTIIVMAEEVPPVNGIGYLPFVRHLTDALIVVVGHGGESSVSRALFQGADAYVTRPIDDSELLARFNSLRRRERSQASESRGQTARPPP